MKRKLIIEEWLSLDGYVSDKMGKLDFFIKHVRESYTLSSRIDFLNSIDTILLGRKTYEQFSALWPQRPAENDLLAEKMNGLNKMVFSGTLEDAPWGSWPAASVDPNDPITRIKTLKSQPGKNMVVWGSIMLAQTLMKADLVDEYHLHLCPALTGGGRRLFPDNMNLSSLSLLETSPYSNGAVFISYNTSL
jgi:dihydrofolate reductase